MNQPAKFQGLGPFKRKEVDRPAPVLYEATTCGFLPLDASTEKLSLLHQGCVARALEDKKQIDLEQTYKKGVSVNDWHLNMNFHRQRINHRVKNPHM